MSLNSTASLRQAALRGEVHLPNDGIGQQFLAVAPEQLLAHLRLELDLYRLKILHPALGRDEGVVGAEMECSYQTSSKLCYTVL